MPATRSRRDVLTAAALAALAPGAIAAVGQGDLLLPKAGFDLEGDVVSLAPHAGKARQAYGVTGIPHMVISGRDGQVLKVYRGYDESLIDDIVVDINKALATKG